MKNPHDINYIGPVEAEWVDPKVELPPDRTYVVCLWGVAPIVGEVISMGFREGDNWGVLYLREADPHIVPPIRWLRVGGPSTAIPRAQVQAAVDEMAREFRMSYYYLDSNGPGINTFSLIFKERTGITPTEVTP